MVLILFFISFHSTQGINWEQFSDGITMILSQGDVQYAKDHGVAKLGEDVRIFIELKKNILCCVIRMQEDVTR